MRKLAPLPWKRLSLPAEWLSQRFENDCVWHVRSSVAMGALVASFKSGDAVSSLGGNSPTYRCSNTEDGLCATSIPRVFSSLGELHRTIVDQSSLSSGITSYPRQPSNRHPTTRRGIRSVTTHHRTCLPAEETPWSRPTRGSAQSRARLSGQAAACPEAGEWASAWDRSSCLAALLWSSRTLCSTSTVVTGRSSTGG
jgi:hypothetical protein